ncbi:MAG: hypothetical protein ABIK92_16355 [Pseudomonadota bacterium]
MNCTEEKFWEIQIKRRTTVVEKDIKAMKEIAQKIDSQRHGGMFVYPGDGIKNETALVCQ